MRRGSRRKSLALLGPPFFPLEWSLRELARRADVVSHATSICCGGLGLRYYHGSRESRVSRPRGPSWGHSAGSRLLGEAGSGQSRRCITTVYPTMFLVILPYPWVNISFPGIVGLVDGHRLVRQKAVLDTIVAVCCHPPKPFHGFGQGIEAVLCEGHDRIPKSGSKGSPVRCSPSVVANHQGWINCLERLCRPQGRRRTLSNAGTGRTRKTGAGKYLSCPLAAPVRPVAL